jgi:gliding motility-associated-like protein
MVTVIIDFNVGISNLMTPNGDGYNDRWIIQNVENYPDTKAVIVNREGQTVYSSDSYDNNFDGKNQYGKTLPDGTYYYVVQIKGSEKVYKGAITILREGKK